MSTQLSQQPWWSGADDAELDSLAWDFAQAAIEHRRDCLLCAPGQPWCDELQDAWQAIYGWREARRRVSKARWLRERQTADEQAADVTRRAA